MKIGILTFQRAYNYGAFLQCYALQAELKNRYPNCRIEVVDYESSNMARYYKTNIWNYLFGPKNTINNFRIRERMQHLKTRVYNAIAKNSGIKSYYSNKKIMPIFDKCMCKLPLSEERLVSDSYDESIEFIKKQNYDIVVVGSDAVWNDYQTNIPSIFYLSKSVTATKLSYAASCYGYDYNREKVSKDNNLKEALDDFSYIGVRDTETERYIELIDSSLTVNHNCDPSLLLNLNCLGIDMNALKEKMQKHGISFDRPIVGVMGNSKIGKMAREICGPEVQIVAVYYNNEYCDAALLDLTPLEWACVFRFFNVTFTSFFHGTIFSLKNGTPTITIEQNPAYAENHITKTKDLLNRLGLDYYVSKENQNEEYLRSLYDKITSSSQKELILAGINRELEYSGTFFDKLDSIVGEK